MVTQKIDKIEPFERNRLSKLYGKVSALPLKNIIRNSLPYVVF